MLAMQYSFTLPADYDMAIIERRIAENGHRLDGFPGLLFKTYLYARQNCPLIGSKENVYAPFYLWQDADSMHQFLLGAGFEALTQAFGWPQVKVYPVLAASLADNIDQAKFATRQFEPIERYSSLTSLSDSPALDGALAQVVAWDTQNWQLIRISLWQTLRQKSDASRQNYQIGHISLPAQRP